MKALRRFRQLLRRSVTTRALVSSLVLLGVSALFLIASFLATQRKSSQEQLELRALALADFIAKQAQFPLLVGDRSELSRIADGALSNRDVAYLEISGADSVLIQAGREDRKAAFGQRPAGPAGTAGSDFRIVSPDLLEVRRLVRPPTRGRLLDWETGASSEAPLGLLRMGFSMREQQAALRSTLLWGSVAIGLGVCVILSVQYLQLVHLLHPLKTLMRFTDAVGSGDLSQRARVDREDEIGHLAAAFNRMVTRLGETTVSKDYVDNIIQSMGESLIVVDASMVICTVNRATLALLRCEAGDLLGQPVSVVAGDSTGGAVQSGVERVYRARNGQEIPVLFSSGVLHGPSGEVQGYVWLAQDMTERKRVDEERNRAREAAEQASRAKSTFLANMSHELRTPLNAVIGYSQMLMEDCGPEAEAMRQDLEKIERAGQMLLGLINDVLDISKIEAGKMDVDLQPFEVSPVVRDVVNAVQPLARQRANRIRVRCPEEDPVAYADVAKFRQSLLNLVNNACKFTESGTISVDLSRTTQAGRDWLVVKVADTGIGISPDQLARLFQPFSQVDGSATRKYGGSGLGLAISRKFHQMMGGDITVESTPGRGSVFTAWVPAAPPAEKAGGEARKREDAWRESS